MNDDQDEKSFTNVWEKNAMTILKAMEQNDQCEKDHGCRKVSSTTDTAICRQLCHTIAVKVKLIPNKNNNSLTWKIIMLAFGFNCKDGRLSNPLGRWKNKKMQCVIPGIPSLRLFELYDTLLQQLQVCNLDSFEIGINQVVYIMQILWYNCNKSQLISLIEEYKFIDKVAKCVDEILKQHSNYNKNESITFYYVTMNEILLAICNLTRLLETLNNGNVLNIAIESLIKSNLMKNAMKVLLHQSNNQTNKNIVYVAIAQMWMHLPFRQK